MTSRCRTHAAWFCGIAVLSACTQSPKPEVLPTHQAALRHARAIRSTCAWLTPSSSPSLSIVLFEWSAHPDAIRLNADLTASGCDHRGWDCVFVRVTSARQPELDAALRGEGGTRSFSAARSPDVDLDLIEVAGRSDDDFAAWAALAPGTQVIAVGERLFSVVDPSEPSSVHRTVSAPPALDEYLRGPGGGFYTSNINEMVGRVTTAFKARRCDRGLLTLNTLEGIGPTVLRGEALLPALVREGFDAEMRAVLVSPQPGRRLESARVPLTVTPVHGRLSVAYADGVDPIPVVRL